MGKLVTLEIISIFITILVSTSLIGCTPFWAASKQDKAFDAYINGDGKNIASLTQEYTISDRSSNPKAEGVDNDFKELFGDLDILNIYTGENSADVSFSLKLKSGNARVVLINSKKEVIDIVKNNGEGKISVKLPAGRSVIKCIGSNATGNLKINVAFQQETPKNNKAFGEFQEDGIFTFSDYKIVGDNMSATLYHVNVVNKKADKLAKINISGKLMNGRGSFQFNDDGFGNSGTVDFYISPTRQVSFRVTIDKRSNSSAAWGFKEGAFTLNDEPMPDYLKGL